MSETVYRLAYPVEIKGEPLLELTLRRPTVRDLRLLDKTQGDVAKTAALISGLAGLAPVDVDLLDAADFTALGQVIADFLPNAQATGGV